MELNTKILKLLSQYIDKNNPKEELNYLFIDSKKGDLVATNTRALIKIKSDEPPMQGGGLSIRK